MYTTKNAHVHKSMHICTQKRMPVCTKQMDAHMYPKRMPVYLYTHKYLCMFIWLLLGKTQIYYGKK